MLDEFRDEANASPFFEDETEEYYEEVRQYRPRKKILGMTAAQRLVIAIMVLFMTCIVGGLMLLVFGIVVPPALF
jgi:hypothetical protein